MNRTIKYEKCFVCKKFFDINTMKPVDTPLEENYTCEDCSNPDDCVCSDCLSGHTDYPEIQEFKDSGHTEDCINLRNPFFTYPPLEERLAQAKEYIERKGKA